MPTDISKHPLAPTLHKPIEMGTRVIADLGGDLKLNGTVEGVSMMHAAWAYIVILDEPYDIPDIGPVKAITALGSQLRTEAVYPKSA